MIKEYVLLNPAPVVEPKTIFGGENMKKYLWIVALLTALSLAFIGCPNGDNEKEPPEPPSGTELVTVWEMATAENIQALEGGLTIAADDDESLKPLVRAGGASDVTIETLKVDGKTAIKFTTGATWGAGIDLRYEAFGFQAQDNIKITGSVLGGDGRAQINFSIGAEDAKGTEVASGAINWDVTLDAATVATISKTSPAGLRIEGRPGDMVVQINNIVITGYRPTDIVALAAPVVTVTENGVEWTAVEGASGYKVFVDDAEEPITTTASDRLFVNLNSIRALDPGTYSITVVAVGVTGVSTDSPKSTPVSYTKPEPEDTSLKLTILDEGEYWSYKATDAMENPNGLSLKGNLKADISAQILSYTNGEVWVYWVYVGDAPDGVSANNGIGAFGGKGYNSGEGGMSGIAIISISDLDLSAQPSYVPANELYLNTYNACAVVKIEIYAEDSGDLYELGDFTYVNNATQKGWGFNGVDGDFDWDVLVAAKYLVVETLGSSNRDGFGGIQVILQSDGNEYAWNATSQSNITDGWVSFSNTEEDTVFIVIQLNTLVGYEAFIGGTKGKIVIAYYSDNIDEGLGYQNAYLVGDILTPADAVDLKDNEAGDPFGYITKGE